MHLGLASSKPAQLLGGQETHTCANGSSFTCSGGTRGCFDNSPSFCGTGGSESHTCADGRIFPCQGGTQGCFDNSPTFCGEAPAPPHRIGKWEHHTCPDGSRFRCHGGTRLCYDNSPHYCPTECSDGAVAVCLGGSYVQLATL